MTTVSAATSKGESNGQGATTADIEKQLYTIRDDIAELTKQVGGLIEGTRSEALTRMKSHARDAKTQAEDMMSDVTDKGREAVDSLREVADTVGDAIEDSLARRPYATLAIVAGVGFLFGAAWRR